ncbi:TPA: type III-A CRISPR-associated protein Csm2, partial [Candidatus Micrarchaeota archaeon]|nr:type III-A CRISPR-associated protein Csm2 [Candidatus Micrarchaeota archaeon]
MPRIGFPACGSGCGTRGRSRSFRSSWGSFPRMAFPGTSRGWRWRPAGPNSRRGKEVEMPGTVGTPVSEGELRRIVCEPLAGDLLVRVADDLGERLSSTLKASQIRAIFDETHRIGSLFRIGKFEEAVRRAHLLDPKIAYRAKRIAEREKKAK